jgi:hypothetical protein
MNDTIKGMIIVVAITSVLVVGATSMVPIIQNSFAHKKSDFKQAERDTNTNININTNTNVNTNTNSADSTSSSSGTPFMLTINKYCKGFCQPGLAFSITVTGNDPQPSSFTIKDKGHQTVLLGPGTYTITETQVADFYHPIFSGLACKQTGPNTATGSASISGRDFCDIINTRQGP